MLKEDSSVNIILDVKQLKGKGQEMATTWFHGKGKRHRKQAHLNDFTEKETLSSFSC